MSGPFGSSQWMYNSNTGFYNGVATTSFRNIPGATLTENYGTPTSSTTMSFGGWVKKTRTGFYSNLYSSTLGGGGVEQASMYFDTDDKLKILSYTGSAYIFNYITTRVFRDTSSWCHIWVQIDTTDATQADRVKIWINGERETSFSTETQVGSGSPDVSGFNKSGKTQYFGHTNASYGGHVYYADWYFVDGTATSPVNSVGEFKNGVFIPKNYSPTFGDNGWRLKFNQTGTGAGSATTIGADSSGNDNHFASSNVDTHDCAMLDCPELNFCTLSSLHLPSNTGNQLIEGALVADATASSWSQAPASWAFQAGEKWYWEVSADNTAYYVGVGSPDVVRQSANALIGWDSPLREAWVYNSGGQIRYNGANQTTTTAITANDILAFAVDVDAGTLRFYLNNVLKYTASHDFTGWFPDAATINQVYLRHNFGQDGTFAGLHTAQGNTDENGYGDFYYTPPSGYLAMCSANLSTAEGVDPAEDNSPADHFNTVTFTGTGSTQAITGVGFQTDFSWFKRRDATANHALYDTIRGNTNALRSNDTSTASQYGDAVVTFQSDGFQIAGTNVSGINGSSESIVSWNWKGAGIGISNTTGSINCETSANTTSGFSIVTYTGNATSGATVGHGLNSAPEFIMFFCRTATGYRHCYHVDVGNTKALYLNTNDAATTDANFLNNTTPSSSVFTLGSSSGANGSSENYVAYCFHSVDGYSSINSYTGNGNADGTFIYTGFRPAFVLVKNASVAQSWRIWDTARNTSNETNLYLTPNGNGAEGSTSVSIDILSNGFKPRGTNASMNGSGNTMVYMAFAENPFEYSNAR